MARHWKTIVAITVVLLGAVAAVMLLLPHFLPEEPKPAPSDNEQAANMAVSNMNPAGNRNENVEIAASNMPATTTTTDISSPTTSASTSPEEQEQPETPPEPAVEQSPVSGDDAGDVPDLVKHRGESAAMKEQNQLLMSIDQERMKQLASEFAYAFLTYDATSLANGAYRASFANLVDGESLKTNGRSELIGQHANEVWETNLVKSNDAVYVRSALLSCDPRSVYVSEKQPLTYGVSLSGLLEANSQEPYESKDWQALSRMNIDFAVYFNSNYQIVDVILQNRDVVAYNINGWQSTPGSIGN